MQETLDRNGIGVNRKTATNPSASTPTFPTQIVQPKALAAARMRPPERDPNDLKAKFTLSRVGLLAPGIAPIPVPSSGSIRGAMKLASVGSWYTATSHSVASAWLQYTGHSWANEFRQTSCDNTQVPRPQNIGCSTALPSPSSTRLSRTRERFSYHRCINVEIRDSLRCGCRWRNSSPRYHAPKSLYQPKFFSVSGLQSQRSRPAGTPRDADSPFRPNFHAARSGTPIMALGSRCSRDASVSAASTGVHGYFQHTGSMRMPSRGPLQGVFDRVVQFLAYPRL